MASKLLIDGSTATGALTHPAPSATRPTGSNSWNVSDKNSVTLVFGGSDGDGETVNYQVIGWREQAGVNDVLAYVPIQKAKGAATFGTDVYTSTILGAAGNLWADTITIATANLHARVSSVADNTIAFLEIDVHDVEDVTVDTDLGTAASADVFIRDSKERLGPDLTQT